MFLGLSLGLSLGFTHGFTHTLHTLAQKCHNVFLISTNLIHNFSIKVAELIASSNHLFFCEPFHLYFFE